MALFAPFRALGYVTDDVPFAVERKGKETFVTLSVGYSWQIYNCTKLTLALVGPPLPGKIRALECKGEHTYSAVGSRVHVCKRVHLSHQWDCDAGPILQLLILGDYLLCLHRKSLSLLHLNETSTKSTKKVSFHDGFEAACMAHPPTYLNKVLVGGNRGSLQLWNISSNSLVHTFSGWKSPITSLQPSPALDVVGVGLVDGSAVLHNVKFDKTVMTLANASGTGTAAVRLRDVQDTTPAPTTGACQCLAFRTGAGPPLMAAGGASGVITVWNLEDRKLQTVLQDAHRDGVVRLHFFPGEPVLMSSGRDNAVKHWIFDNQDGSGRLLRFRSGHAAPPTQVAHYGDTGRLLLTAAQDREVRLFSVVQDQQSRELSQRHVQRRAKRLKVDERELKLPAAHALSASAARERDWENVLTAHPGEVAAMTWHLAKYRIGEHELAPPPKQLLDSPSPSPATAVYVTLCGNFGLVGSATGRVDRYNMQSGAHRVHYAHKSVPNGRDQRHNCSPVVSVGCDARNTSVFSVSHSGGVFKWAFKGGKAGGHLQLESAAVCAHMHPHTVLAAVACVDREVLVLDLQALKVVRRFRGHADRLTAVQLSSSCEWVLSGAMDGTLRVWSVPAAVCLQVLRLGNAITSLSLAPDQQLLATTHAGRRGVYLWFNQMLFGAIQGFTPSSTPVDVELPGAYTGSRGAEATDLPNDLEMLESDDEDESATTVAGLSADEQELETQGRQQLYASKDNTGAPRPLAPGLVTLSGQPLSNWEALSHIDAIRVRNKPVKPPEKPEAAPFFLPSAPTLPSAKQPDVQVAGEQGEGSKGQEGRLVKSMQPLDAAWTESPLLRRLADGCAKSDFSDATRWLLESSAVAVDNEVRSISSGMEGAQDDVAAIGLLLKYVANQVDRNINFDHAQAFLSLVLDVHGNAIARSGDLCKAAQHLHTKLSAAWARIDDDIHAVQCMVSLFSRLDA